MSVPEKQNRIGRVKALFLDRDGVINELVYYGDLGIIDSPFTVEQFKLLPNVAKTLRMANKLGLKTIIVSNQPGVAKKHFSIKTLREMDRKMKIELAKDDAHIDAIYYCLHHPAGKNRKYAIKCNCRKPKPGLILRAADELGIDLKHSYMIGDELTDIKAGKTAGCKTILIGTLKCQFCKEMDKIGVRPDYIVKDLYEGIKFIKRLGDYKV
ncbi:MAG: HAD family hydrolase [Elusimicrobiota bacterium]|nr:HAD family hydrolase [Elusimicrobiota bacterium]